MRQGLFVAVACWWFSMARTALAVPFALEYEAPAACPSREAFVGAIRERVPEAEESENAGRLEFRVTIEPEGDLARGQLTLGRDAPPRPVATAPCADVASSMVLMIAIVLSGERSGPDDGAGTESAEEKAANEVPMATPPAPERTAPAASVQAQPARGPASAPTRPRPVTSVAARRERDSFRAGAWGAAGLAGGAAPFPAVAVSGGAELELPSLGVLRPSARAGVTYASGDTTVDGFGGAEFRLLAFAGRVCPHAFALSPRWSLAACATVEVGELTARGVTPKGRVERMPWSSLGVAPRVELALNRTFSLEGELGLRGIVRHDRFIFEPAGAEAYDVPRFSPHLGLGASARFP